MGSEKALSVAVEHLKCDVLSHQEGRQPLQILISVVSPPRRKYRRSALALSHMRPSFGLAFDGADGEEREWATIDIQYVNTKAKSVNDEPRECQVL